MVSLQYSKARSDQVLPVVGPILKSSKIQMTHALETSSDAHFVHDKRKYLHVVVFFFFLFPKAHPLGDCTLLPIVRRHACMHALDIAVRMMRVISHSGGAVVFFFFGARFSRQALRVRNFARLPKEK